MIWTKPRRPHFLGPAQNNRLRIRRKRRQHRRALNRELIRPIRLFRRIQEKLAHNASRTVSEITAEGNESDDGLRLSIRPALPLLERLAQGIEAARVERVELGLAAIVKLDA